MHTAQTIAACTAGIINKSGGQGNKLGESGKPQVESD